MSNSDHLTSPISIDSVQAHPENDLAPNSSLSPTPSQIQPCAQSSSLKLKTTPHTSENSNPSDNDVHLWFQEGELTNLLSRRAEHDQLQATIATCLARLDELLAESNQCNQRLVDLQLPAVNARVQEVQLESTRLFATMQQFKVDHHKFVNRYCFVQRRTVRGEMELDDEIVVWLFQDVVLWGLFEGTDVLEGFSFSRNYRAEFRSLLKGLNTGSNQHGQALEWQSGVQIHEARLRAATTQPESILLVRRRRQVDYFVALSLLRASWILERNSAELTVTARQLNDTINEFQERRRVIDQETVDLEEIGKRAIASLDRAMTALDDSVLQMVILSKGT